MTGLKINSRHTAVILTLPMFFLFGAVLFIRPISTVLSVEGQIIYDLMWLDAWSVGFLLMQAIIWLSGLSGRQKAWLGVTALALYGAVEIALIFNGTPFSLNAFWGDQKFRQAMLTKFMTWAIPGDFYYKGLPPFYPPVYYLILAWAGKIFGWRPWELMKIGSLLIYFGWPFVLFVCWRKMVGALRAWMVVLFTMLVCSHALPYVLAAPHAFLANTLFIPWWLIYIEQVPGRTLSWRSIFMGGLIGAFIFTTYFYPFFIAAFLLFLRLTFLRGWEWFSRPTRFRWRSALGVLGTAALLSAPYWLPVLSSLFTSGVDRSRGGWHHIDSPGLNFVFLDMTVPGLLFLAGIWYCLRRGRRGLNRGLLTLFGSVIVFWMAGSILGALDRPVNLVKARDWLIVFGGPMIGLMVTGFVRRRSLPRRQHVAPAMLVILMLVFVNAFNQSIRNPMVKTARTAQVPDWGIDESTAAERKGSIYLSGVEEFASFYPVYSFIAANEHYSHPAARFKDRFNLLALLHDLQHPGVFALALRHNMFDSVDFFMPLARKGELQLIVSLSNYPNGHHTCIFGYPRAFVANAETFEPVEGTDTYRLHDPRIEADFAASLGCAVDTVKLAMIGSYLTEEGKKLLAEYTGVDPKSSASLLKPGESRLVGGALDLVGCVATERGDSMDIAIAYRPFRQFKDSCRVYLHVAADGAFYNFDFDPPTQVSQWPIDSLIVLHRTIPAFGPKFRIFTGLFTKDGPLDGGLATEYHLSD